jgi:hypothetical protein
MNYVALSVIIETYKQKRKRVKKKEYPKASLKKMTPPCFPNGNENVAAIIVSILKCNFIAVCRTTIVCIPILKFC